MDEDGEDLFEPSSTSSSSLSLHTIPDTDNIAWACHGYSAEELCRLDRAALLNDVDEVKRLLSLNWNVNSNDTRGNTCVHYAAFENSVEALEVIVRSEDLRVDLQNFFGETPFHSCLSRDPELKTLDVLFNAGFSLAVTNSMGFTPLELYFDTERPKWKTAEVIEWVAARDVDLITRLCLNKIIMMYKDDCLEVLNVLYFYGCDWNRVQYSPFDQLYEHPFIEAWRYCGEEVYSFFFDFVDFNAESPNGKTVFSKAMELDTFFHKEGKNWFLEMIRQGADINWSSCLSTSCEVNVETFEYIWRNCERDRVVRSDPNFFIRLLRNRTFPFQDYLRLVYDVLYSDQLEIIASYTEGLTNYVIEALHHIKDELDQTERAKMLFTVLTYDDAVDVDMLESYFRVFSFDEGFEAFLKITVHLLYLSTTYLEQPFKFICFPHLEMVVSQSEVPSLKLLARNAVRKRLRRPEGNVIFGYYNEVQRLNVPQIVKDMICLKVVLC